MTSDYTSTVTLLAKTDRTASADTSNGNLIAMSLKNDFHLAQLHDGTGQISPKRFRHY